MHTRLIAIAAAIMLGTGSAATARAASDEPVVVDVTAGRNHACLLLDDGAVACWGSNFTGALGTGDRYTRVVPQLVDLPKAATAVVAGGDHTCALLVDGTVACWGRNWEAQLGTGSDSEPVTVPVPVKGLDSVVEIAAGQDHTCALRSDATAWCWGNGGNGQVGPDWNYGMTAPVRVTGVGDVVGLSAGLYQTCLRLEDGTVPCFGFYPREGDNSARSSVPTPVAGFAGAVALAGGESYECAVVPDRTVRCFGYNDYGWLGDGTLTTHPDTDTVAAVGIDTAVDITASFSHACALLEGGSAACWGFESHGELGTPPSEDQWTPVPQPVPGIDGITAISAGWGFTCAVVAGSGLCWGRNEEGELGDRTIVSRPTPAPLSWVPDTTAPTAQAPFIGIRADDKELRGNRVDVRIEPTGADDPGGTGIDHFELQVSTDDGSTWSPRRSQARRFNRSVPMTGSTMLRFRAVDRLGNVGSWRTDRVRASVVQQSADAIRYHGTWRTSAKSAYSGGTTRYTTEAGASATYRFTGRSIAIVSRQALTRGAFKVYVDGTYAGKVDLHDDYARYRLIAFSRRWATSGEHAIRMVAVGGNRHPRVDLDAFIVLR